MKAEVRQRMKDEGGRMKNNGESRFAFSFILHPSSFILYLPSFILYPHPSGLEKVLKSKIGVRCDMKPYGTYQRFAYQTAPLPAINLDGVWPALRALALALALTALVVTGMLAALAVAPLVAAGLAAMATAVVGAMTAVGGAVVALAVVVLPVLAKLVGGALIIAAVGWVTYPKGAK